MSIISILLLFISIFGSIVQADQSGLLNPCEPQGIHINFGNYYAIQENHDKEYQMQIIYYTLEKCPLNYVLYGQNNQQQNSINSQEIKQIENLAYFHTVYLSDLHDYEANVEYQIYYPENSSENQQFLSEKPKYLKTKQYSFVLHRNNQKGDQNSKIIFFGDFDTNVDPSTNKSLGQDTVNALTNLLKEQKNKEEYKAIVHTGDMAYDMMDENGQRALKYLRDTQEFTAEIPYVSVAGNHENDINLYLTAYPNVAQNNKLYYSWNLGNMHFIGLYLVDYNDEKYAYQSEFQKEQIEWLKKDLEIANLEGNRDEYSWIVVYTHMPFYCSFDDGEDYNDGVKRRHDCKKARKKGLILEVEEILKQGKVDLILESHVHQMERSYPVYSEKKTQDYVVEEGIQVFRDVKDPIYLLEGVAGNHHFLEDQNYPLLEYTAYHHKLNIDGVLQTGFGVISSSSRNEMLYEHVSSLTGEVTDTFKIVRSEEYFEDGIGPQEEQHPNEKEEENAQFLIMIFVGVGLGFVIYWVVKKYYSQIRRGFLGGNEGQQKLEDEQGSKNETSNIQFEMPTFEDNNQKSLVQPL